MQRYSKLVGADIYRDGGSLEAQFMRSDGAFETLWLQVHPDWIRGRCVQYLRLEMYGDLERRVTPCIVEIGSETERDIVAGLREFLSNPVVDVPFAHRTPNEHFLQHVRDLLSHIPGRGHIAEPDGTGRIPREPEPRIVYWFVHPSTVPPTPLGFIRTNGRGALLIGGLTGSHMTGHADTWRDKFRLLISDGYIPIEVAQAQGLVAARWKPPELDDTDDVIVKRIQKGEI